MLKKPIIIDTDPGIDDAVALALALFSKELDVKLITTVVGNVSLEKVTRNTLQLLTFYGKNIPVAAGARKPLLRQAFDASSVHGDSGLGAYRFPDFQDTNLLEQHAVVAMYNTIINSDSPVTLVPIGPLTNIALLLTMFPDIKPQIKEIILMGGAIGRGNSGIYSEFNITIDPEAADIVMNSGLTITMVPLEIGRKALVFPEDALKIKEMHSIGDMFYKLFKTYRGGSFNTGLKMYDGSAIAYLLKPELFTTQKAFVAVETKGDFTSGATIIDLQGNLGKDANVTVATDINPDEFKKWFMETIEKCV
ncbi:ribonucleoside hydrolase RihC [Streptococcus merionis]|uniref:ribonucleoside hydrolase RihC n=1 Tax=Streptococcus merionis TaxID=400065 RepID=UPI0026F2A3BA|nr:ribonucleoside hydrolase RihC [Streptococcus merionis]